MHTLISPYYTYLMINNVPKRVFYEGPLMYLDTNLD